MQTERKDQKSINENKNKLVVCAGPHSKVSELKV